MKDFGAEKAKDGVLLAARVLLVVLFLIFGWGKLVDFGGTLGYFTKAGVALPSIAAVVAVVMEFPVGIALALGLLTRPLALALAVYTFGAAMLGHPYWTMTGEAAYMNEINFYKNIGIIGGLLALYVAGAGKFSVDAKLKLA